MEEISRADRVYVQSCYIQCDVTVCKAVRPWTGFMCFRIGAIGRLL